MSCVAGHCITCSDEGIELRVIGIDLEAGTAVGTDEAGARHTVDVALIGPLAVGDRLLAHAGVALVLLEGALT